MGTKPSIPLSEKFPHADPMALSLLQRLLAFDPKQRPSAEEVRFRAPISSLGISLIKF